MSQYLTIVLQYKNQFQNKSLSPTLALLIFTNINAGLCFKTFKLEKILRLKRFSVMKGIM